MWNGVILSILFLIILVFLGVVLTSITSVLFVSVFFTPVSTVKEIAKIIGAKDEERVVDLGSGDGRVVMAISDTAKIKGFGYDISPLMVILSKVRKLFTLRLNRDLTFDVVSLFDVKYNEYDIIYCNLNKKIMERLSEKFKRQLEGTKVFSYEYEVANKKAYKKHTLSNSKILFEYHY
ncbi:class I SAM-dependent methyltransferase [Candidatus Dojkabacteria bacterium]|nr:class I SAM-dependent methyltransferase [Candidatus Dojkabacteria bacterium]